MLLNDLKKYKFSETASKKIIFKDIKVKEFLKQKYDGGYNFGVDNLLNYGEYKVDGWIIDFKPVLKLYLLKQYNNIQEYYAPNKTMLRKVTQGKIDWIKEF